MHSSTSPSLLDSITLGDSIALRNRICMGAMTRNRCINNKPGDASVKHYVDRAKDGVGLIVAEGTFVYLHGSEFPHSPVMFTNEHAVAWRKVTDGVHREGGKIFFQAWHAGKLPLRSYFRGTLTWQTTGRAQNENMPMLKENNYPVLAPSNIAATGGKYRVLEGNPVSTNRL